MVQFHTVLRVLRKWEKLTQEQLARKLKETKGVISKWEQGRGKPGRESLVRLFHFARAPLCWRILEAAGISFELVEKKISDYKEYLGDREASKYLGALEKEVERQEAEELGGRKKKGGQNVALRQSNPHSPTSPSHPSRPKRRDRH